MAKGKHEKTAVVVVVGRVAADVLVAVAVA